MERNFAAVMSELRHARGLSQRKVAADLKISQALLSHYENGAREPGLAFVCRACDYYGVSADFLLGRAPSPTCTPEQLEALRALVQDVRTAADRAEAALEEISLGSHKKTSAIFRSSRTLTTASPPCPTGSSSCAAPWISAKWRTSCSTTWISSVSAASRSRHAPSG